jgi:hypothetical protein
MSRIVHPLAPVTCPTCAWVSVRAPHYCPGCGYDYWRAAAGLDATPSVATPVVQRRADGRFSAALMIAGLVGLLTTGVVTAVVVLGGSEPERPVIVDTLPSRSPEDFMVLRFFREARDPYAAFTVDIHGTLQSVEPKAPDIPLSQTMVVHGSDWAVYNSVESDGQRVLVSSALIGDTYYERVGTDGPWARAEVSGNSEPVSPFARIATVGEIEYLGMESADGVELHHLLVTKWLGGSGREFRMLGFEDVTDTESRFDIWVNDEGVPVRGRQVTTFSVVEAGTSYTFHADVTMTFRDWDDAGPIEAPA